MAGHTGLSLHEMRILALGGPYSADRAHFPSQNSYSFVVYKSNLILIAEIVESHQFCTMV
jgi:hypothetical protein